MNTAVAEEYVSVQEAAAALRVHRSTIRRWIAQGELPAYRVGQRKIVLKQSDLSAHVSPAQPRPNGGAMARVEAHTVPAFTKREQRQALAAVEAARGLQAQLLASRGGERFSSSGEILNQLRDARSQQMR